MFDRWFRTACCAALIVVPAWLLPAAAAEDDSFTVANVHEDVTAASALAAKDQAQADGQQKAYDELMSRLAPGKSPHLNAEQLTDLVAAFEVANEHTSTVRYVADYTFHFNPAAIRRLLQDPSIASVQPAYVPAGRSVIVLPVYSQSDRAVLWDDPNPWRDAWAAHAGGPGSVPITVPVGDLPDVSAIDAPKAIAGDPGALKEISARYQNDDVLVVQAKMHDTPRRLDTTVTRYSPDSPGTPQSVLVMTSAKPDETEASLMGRAVFNVMAHVGSSWQPAAAALDPNEGGTLDAVMQSGSLTDWVTVRNRLRAVPAVRSADLVSFDRNRLRVAIRYVGDQNQLRAALRQRNLDLTGSDPDWNLVIQTAAPPPAPPKPDSGAIQPGALRKAAGQP
jgi:hypothetical protein